MIKNKTQLLCTFIKKENIDEIVNKIKSTYSVQNDKILIIENIEDSEEVFCVYNILNKLDNKQLKDTILIHRKREYNTLYTINSLNLLIISLNNKQDSKFIIPWENYKNMFLLIKGKELRLVKTQLYKIIKIN